MNRLGNIQGSVTLIADIVVSILVILYVLVMLSLVWLGQAPLGLPRDGEMWMFGAFVLAAAMLLVPLSRNVRIGLTIVLGVLLASMVGLFLRGEAPLGMEDPFGMLPIVLLVFAASGLAPRVRTRSGRGWR